MYSDLKCINLQILFDSTKNELCNKIGIRFFLAQHLFAMNLKTVSIKIMDVYNGSKMVHYS